MKGQVATYFVLNPHPTLIPPIEAVVETCYFGREVGMEDYVEPGPDIFPTGADGACAPTRTLRRWAGQWPAICSSAARCRSIRLATARPSQRPDHRLGGAPNMGSDARGRRHASPAWLKAGREAGETLRGRKLVVQMVADDAAGWHAEFCRASGRLRSSRGSGIMLPPVMIYEDDVDACRH